MDGEVLALSGEQLEQLKKKLSRTVKDGSYVRVSRDRMRAWMYVAKPVGSAEKYTADVLSDMLQAEGVTTGYLTARLVAIAKKGVYEREILVAEGKRATEGSDGYYEYFFTPERMKESPAIRGDGSVDYSSMNMLQNVQAGDMIAKYHEAVGGEDGYTVDGQPLKTKPVKELQPLRGMSVEHRDNFYFAKVSGKIEMKKGVIDIRTVHEVRGDVDLSIGRIEFFGDVIISGNVSAGVLIRAGRNIIIDGTVESAELFAGGDIVLKRGVQGNMRGRVRSRGSVYANFIEQCEVNAEGNVEANYILNTDVTAGGKVIVRGKRGSIIGGTVFALRGVDSYNLGNSVQVKTIVQVGYEQEVYNRYVEAVEEEKELREKLEDTLETMKHMIRGRQFQKEASNENVLILNGKKDQYFKRLDEIKDVIRQCRERIEQGEGAVINVEGVTNRGVVVNIGRYKKAIAASAQYTTYRYAEGEIRLEPFQRENTEV